MAHEYQHQQHHHHHHHHQPDFISATNNAAAATAVALHGFGTNHELYDLQAGMEMLGIPSKQPHAQNVADGSWKVFFPKAGSSSTIGFSQPSTDAGLMGAPEPNMGTWPPQSNRMAVVDPSIRCLLPSEGGEQANRELSLSLCNADPSGSGFHYQVEDASLRKPEDSLHQQEVFFFGPSAAAASAPMASLYQQHPQQLKNSKYLLPAQELLNEFCSLGKEHGSSTLKRQSKISKQWDEGGSSSSSSPWTQPLHTLEILELQKRKAKLYSMLEEVSAPATCFYQYALLIIITLNSS